MPTREYYEKNKERILKQNKEYREKNKNKIAIMKKEYRELTKEEMKEYQKEYRKNNKEKLSLLKREWYLNNNRNHRKELINNWKSYGLIEYDYDGLYDHFLKTERCDICNTKLTTDRYITATTKCLDHCHTTRYFRGILCNDCNKRDSKGL